MTTYFIDPINGVDTNNGLSYATAVKTISSSSLSGVVGGDEVRILETPLVDTGFDSTFVFQRNNFFAVAVTSATNASPIQITTLSDYSLITGDWVYITGVAGNTNANGMWKVTVINGNTITLNGSAGNAAYISGGALRIRTGSLIPIPANCIKNISYCGNQGQTAYPYAVSNWTASTNVTCAIQTSSGFRTFNCSQSIGIVAAFTTGKIAYQALGSTVDFSAYQGISLTISMSTSVGIADNVLYIALCSDTTGDVVVNQLNLTGLSVAINNNSCAYKINSFLSSGNLGSNIQSIAIYAASDPGAVTFQIDNIVAVKILSDTSSVTVKHLLNDGIQTNGYYSIGGLWQDVDGTPVALIDSSGTSVGSQNSPYYGGTGGTKRLYTVLPFYTAPQNANTNIIYTVGFNSVTTPLTITGGWSASSNMSARTGLSAYAVTNGVGILFQAINKNNFVWENVCFGYAATGLSISGNSNTSYKNCHFYGCSSAGHAIATTLSARFGLDFSSDTTAYPCTFTACASGQTQTGCIGSLTRYCHYLSNISYGLWITLQTSSLIDQCRFNCSSIGTGVKFASGQNKVTNSSFNCNVTALISDTNGGNCLIKKCTFDIFGASAVNFGNVVGSTIQSCTFSTSKLTTYAGVSASGASNVNVVGCDMESNLAAQLISTNQSIVNFLNCTNMSSSSSVAAYGSANTITVYTNCSNLAKTTYWSGSAEPSNIFSKTSGTASNSHSPADTGISTGGVMVTFADVGLAGSRTANNKPLIEFGRINCTANKLHTVKGWVRSTLGNGSDYCQLALLGGSIAGISSDVVSTPTSDSNWSQHTISFTPTESGVVQIYFSAWGGKEFYYDGLSVNIAS